MFQKLFAKFVQDLRGDFPQLALILVLVVIVAITTLTDLGNEIVTTFQEVVGAM
jgi:hypothetical protein